MLPPKFGQASRAGPSAFGTKEKQRESILRIRRCIGTALVLAGCGVASAQSGGDHARPVRVIPPLADRPLDINEGDRIATTGFRVRGVSRIPELGISPFSVQRLADGLYEQISNGDPLSVEGALERAGEKRGAPVVGLTVGQMQAVAEQVAMYLRQSGLVLAQAYVPVQEVAADGIVNIDVVEAKLGRVLVEGARRMPPALIAASADDLKEGPLTRERIESALLIAQTLPGTAVLGTFRPGQNTGETDLVLRVQNEQTAEFRISADNYGTKFAGEYRARASALIHNPAGFGDQLSLDAVQAFNPADTTFGSIRYSLPMGTPSVRVHLQAEKAAFVADNKTFSLLSVEGDNESFETGLIWDMHRSRTLNYNSGLRFQARKADVEFDNIANFKLTKDDLRVAVLQGGLQRFDTRFKGVDFLDFAYHKGVDRYKDFELIGNDDRYDVLKYSYSRYQRITDNQTLLVVMRGQETNDVLSALERFSLGGPDSVRAYPVSEILTDRGFLGSLEYRIAAPGFSQARSPFGGQPWGRVLQFTVFGDYAWGERVLNDPGDEIYGAGVGILLTAPHVTFKLTGATPLGSIDPSDGDDFRVYSELSLLF